MLRACQRRAQAPVQAILAELTRGERGWPRPIRNDDEGTRPAARISAAGVHAVAGIAARYLTDENAVGCRKLLVIVATIGPSFSVSARFAIHSGSAMKAFHFCSRSARLSQASR